GVALALATCVMAWQSVGTGEELPSRRIALTFDDLPAQRAARLPPARIASILPALIEELAGEGIPAIGFVNEEKLWRHGELVAERVRLLERWLDAGLELGNHAHSHPDLHRTPLEEYLADILRGEEVTRRLVAERGQELRFFRHPFLHTGTDLDTKQAVERFLAEHGYRVAPVTIDNSEWIFARAYDEALDRADATLGERLSEAYLDYMEAMVAYYEGQSRALFGREIPQVLLLHANDLNADHLPELIDRLRQRGYRFVDLSTALEDPAYDSPDEYVGQGGITWLHRWALTRDVDRAAFAGEPRTPEWVEELAGLRE
ncbi:MAG: polysaccharide deacetylase family protein, partial [Thermoanaerobaculia bacterium]|nr:polysaccharide deacetylase family protein [Thermoanaerobaculia bacterium]